MRNRILSAALFLTLAALPLVLGVGYALLYSLGLTGLIHEGFTLVYWREVLGGVEFWRALGFSVYVAGLSIGLALVLALGVVLRWRRDLESGWLSYFVYLPLALPAMVVAFFSFQLLSRAGLLSRLAYRLGWIEGLEGFPDWINDPYGIGIIFSHVLMATPFFIILLGNLYRSERLAEYAQVALTHGASRRQADHRVVMPVLLRRASATLLLYFVFAMGSYEIPLLLGTQSPQMVSVLTVRKLQRFNLMDIPEAYAISVLYTVFVVAVVIWLLGRERRLTS